MDGIHDLGGRDGFGPIVVEPDEPVFHEPWERTARALIIAVMKGSMVAAVFMHLSHEKRLVYSTLLLTAIFFIVLMLVPLLTSLDTIGIGSPWGPRAGG